MASHRRESDERRVITYDLTLKEKARIMEIAKGANRSVSRYVADVLRAELDASEWGAK